LADSKGYSKSGFYSASKAAATIYLEGLSAELRNYNIKVLTVRPGFVRTPMTDKNEFDMPLLMEPEKASNIIISGIKKEKRMIQFPWQLVWATRLIRFVPNWLFERLESKSMKRYE
jgi:short-subunit dehydrogenase